MAHPSAASISRCSLVLQPVLEGEAHTSFPLFTFEWNLLLVCRKVCVLWSCWGMRVADGQGQALSLREFGGDGGL
jgi:hypothetical protein